MEKVIVPFKFVNNSKNREDQKILFLKIYSVMDIDADVAYAEVEDKLEKAGHIIVWPSVSHRRRRATNFGHQVRHEIPQMSQQAGDGRGAGPPSIWSRQLQMIWE